MKSRHQQQGFTLLEGLVTLGVLMSLLVLGNHYVQQRLNHSFNQSVATHLRTVAAATDRYVQVNYPRLRQEPATRLTVEDLKEAGYLPDTFSKKNIYRQEYAIVVIPQTKQSNQLQILVLTEEGTAISECAMRQISRKLGDAGGYISKNNLELITSGQQGWQLSLDPDADLTLGPALTADARKLLKDPCAGHIASLRYLNTDDKMNTHNLLHRRQVQRYNKKLKQMETDKQLNQMETDLSMGSHQIIFEKKLKTGEDYKTTLKAGSLSLEHTKEKSIVMMGIEPKTNAPVIEIVNTHGGLIFNPKLATTHKPHSILSDTEIKDYSAAELHAYWNKVPYYELTTASPSQNLQDFANKLCRMPAEREENAPALGRLFMLGREQQLDTYLYICSYGVYSKEASAHLMKALQPTQPTSPGKRLGAAP